MDVAEKPSYFCQIVFERKEDGNFRVRPLLIEEEPSTPEAILEDFTRRSLIDYLENITDEELIHGRSISAMSTFTNGSFKSPVRTNIHSISNNGRDNFVEYINGRLYEKNNSPKQ